MPRPRTPREKARITGADRNHPSRFARRSAPNASPLGEPSNWMNDGQRAAWNLIRRDVPWLMESDRALVEIASYLRARLMAGGEVGVGAINQLRMCAAQMAELRPIGQRSPRIWTKPMRARAADGTVFCFILETQPLLKMLENADESRTSLG